MLARRLTRPMSMLALAALGCGESRYIYRPTEQATATSDGLPAARYPVPPESPRGEVNIASFGPTKMQVTTSEEKVKFLHVRMVVANNNDAGPWVVDTRQQVVSLPQEGQSPPAFANSDVPGLPIVNVPAGQKHTIDLFYTLPEGMQKARHVPRFELFWHVQTPSREVAERTPFERTEADEAVASAYPYVAGYPELSLSLGWGPVWWYDPLVPAVTFYHPVIIHRRYPLFVRAPYTPPMRVYGRAVVAPPRVIVARPIRRF
ncbi:MAG: uncharacterized protein JWM53_4388 [bacterium]|nr:uncharacterized protein [bacterium]